MGKGATHLIQTPQGTRHVTPRAWDLLKHDKRYSLVKVLGETVIPEEPKKKEDVVDVADHKVVTFPAIDEDLDEITHLRDQYFELSGKEADKRWKEKTLKAKIDQLNE